MKLIICSMSPWFQELLGYSPAGDPFAVLRGGERLDILWDVLSDAQGRSVHVPRFCTKIAWWSTGCVAIEVAQCISSPSFSQFTMIHCRNLARRCNSEWWSYSSNRPHCFTWHSHCFVTLGSNMPNGGSNQTFLNVPFPVWMAKVE